MRPLSHLDLFSGIGGFALAARMVGAIATAQFVEIDPYCRKVLAKNFPGVPLHDDIRTYSAQPGDFDLITAGFPCQPHSAAGKRQASKDERDLWPQLYRVICEVQPRWVVLENVRGLLSSETGRFFRGVLWDLACAGLDAEWAVIPASDLGASHRRERVWIVAYSNSLGYQRSKSRNSAHHNQRNGQAPEQTGWSKFHETVSSGAVAPDSNLYRCNRTTVPDLARQEVLNTSRGSEKSACSRRTRLAAWQFPSIRENAIAQLKRLDGCDGRGFTSQPLLCRGDDGLSNRVDRIRGLGNAVVPQVAAIALQRVLELAGGAK